MIVHTRKPNGTTFSELVEERRGLVVLNPNRFEDGKKMPHT
jgi:hypothetical protein